MTKKLVIALTIVLVVGLVWSNYQQGISQPEPTPLSGPTPPPTSASAGWRLENPGPPIEMASRGAWDTKTAPAETPPESEDRYQSKMRVVDWATIAPGEEITFPVVPPTGPFKLIYEPGGSSALITDSLGNIWRGGGRDPLGRPNKRAFPAVPAGGFPWKLKNDSSHPIVVRLAREVG